MYGSALSLIVLLFSEIRNTLCPCTACGLPRHSPGRDSIGTHALIYSGGHENTTLWIVNVPSAMVWSFSAAMGTTLEWFRRKISDKTRDSQSLSCFRN